MLRVRAVQGLTGVRRLEGCLDPSSALGKQVQGGFRVSVLCIPRDLYGHGFCFGSAS